jgi:hypothetical protein
MKEDDVTMIVSRVCRLWQKEQNNPKSKSRNEVEMNKNASFTRQHKGWNELI